MAAKRAETAQNSAKNENWYQDMVKKIGEI